MEWDAEEWKDRIFGLGGIFIMNYTGFDDRYKIRNISRSSVLYLCLCIFVQAVMMIRNGIERYGFKSGMFRVFWLKDTLRMHVCLRMFAIHACVYM